MAEAIDQNREIKQRAIRRLTVAVVLVLAAIGILTYLSYYKPPKVSPKPVAETLPPPPPPIVTGPEPQAVQAAPAPTEAPLPAPESALTPAPAAPEPAPAPAPALTVAPPPPPAVVSKPLPKPGPGPKKDSEQPKKPLVKAEPVPAPAPQTAAPAQAAPPAAAAPAPAKPATAPTGYLVQFGVFSSMQNAAQLVERLKQLGIDAQTETKVHLPAFKTKAEADAAMAKMKEKGISAVVVGK